MEKFTYCKYNYVGSIVQVIWKEKGKKVFKDLLRSLTYVTLNNGDNKRYTDIKNVYEGIKIKKLECLGHYHKRKGTR